MASSVRPLDVERSSRGFVRRPRTASSAYRPCVVAQARKTDRESVRGVFALAFCLPLILSRAPPEVQGYGCTDPANALMHYFVGVLCSNSYPAAGSATLFRRARCQHSRAARTQDAGAGLSRTKPLCGSHIWV